MKKRRAKSQGSTASLRNRSAGSEGSPDGGSGAGGSPTESMRRYGRPFYRGPVRLTKIENHRADGKSGNYGIGFWVVGHLVRKLEVGSWVRLESIVCTKTHDPWDWFVTSEIKAIRGNVIETKNSVWRITRA